MQKDLADAILAGDLGTVQSLTSDNPSLFYQKDPYGYYPLEEAAIANHLDMAQWILKQTEGRGLDAIISASLVWAVDNENTDLIDCFLKYGADPNYFSPDGKPVLAFPWIKGHQAISHTLIQAGADPLFAKDYLLTKLVGHRFELSGTTTIVDPTNTYRYVSFEGFFPEISLNIIRRSLYDFIHHYESKVYHSYRPIFEKINDHLATAVRLGTLTHYNSSVMEQQKQISALCTQELWIIPISMHGHFFSLVRKGDYLAICDRRQDTPVLGKVIIYRIGAPAGLTPAFLYKLVYQAHTLSADFRFFDSDLLRILALKPVYAFPTRSQLSGNCSWANSEAAVLAALYFYSQDADQTVTLFQGWQSWDKDHALFDALYDFDACSPARKACMISLLAVVFFQGLDPNNAADVARAKKMRPYFQLEDYRYIMQAYKDIYATFETGIHFQKFVRLLKICSLF
jgi:hypothetical protein